MNDNSHAPAAQVAGSSFMSFFLGAVVGASIALLLAPEKGSDTRNRLASAAKRIGKHARETVDDLAHDAKDALETGQRELHRASRPGV